MGRSGSETVGPESTERPWCRTTAAAVASMLKSEIRQGELGGVSLHQEETARRLGVSRTPVREAFHALEREGWVSRRASGSVMVLTRTEADLRDQLALIRLVYVALVCRAAGAALPRRRELAVLADAASARRVLLQPKLFCLMNRQFLDRVVEVAGSDRLASARKIVCSGHFDGYLVETPGAMVIQQRGLRELARAIRAGAADGASVAMSNLCEAQTELVVQRWARKTR